MAERYEFPDGFLWGAATASYQVEGGIDNNDWAQAADNGRVPPAGKACDHYHRYESDFDLARNLAHNAHRFSIEWARIEPREGEFDEDEIEHYRKVLDALRERGLTPMVTIWHFTLPSWLSESGGIARADFPELFARYAGAIIERLGDKAELWVTINEPLIVSTKGYIEGSWPPFQRRPLRYMRVVTNLIEAHIQAYRRMKEVRRDIRVGIAKFIVDYAANANVFNKLKAWFLEWWWNHRFLNAIEVHQDFIGLNFYLHVPFGYDPVFEKTDMGWNIYPRSIHKALMRLRCYNVPVYVTESGIADADDDQRGWYIRNYLGWVNKAVRDGVDVRGYFYWSLMDNFEWAFGFEKRFGLISIDYKTLERQIRESARDYQAIIEENAVEL